eukprot:3723858-Amphidinium_carterae.1
MAFVKAPTTRPCVVRVHDFLTKTTDRCPTFIVIMIVRMSRCRRLGTYHEVLDSCSHGRCNVSLSQVCPYR